MVYLSKIYTRSGDDGSTGLGDGTRLPKHDLRVDAYGSVDETSSTLGLVLLHVQDEALLARLRQIQNDLFDVGADLCVPGDGQDDKLRVRASYVKRLEDWIDEANEDLAPLNSFILPGGEPGAAWLHLARTVCRRAERLVQGLMQREPARVNPETLRYLNRLSDLLFVLARVVNDRGRKDLLWVPGENAQAGNDAPEEQR